MHQISNQAIWIFLILTTSFLLYLLSPILTPFILGAILAYLANPLVTKLDKWHSPHLVSVSLIFIILFAIIATIVLMLYPLVQEQVEQLSDVIPQLVNWIEIHLMTWLRQMVDVGTLKSTVSAALPKSALVLQTIMKSGYTIIEWVVNLVLTPVVTFYFLRDWEKILHNISSLIPRSIRPTIIKLSKECDNVLSAFFRGQLLVMLALSLIYSIGLTIVGLKIGLVIGLIGGLLSIVPYLGSIFVVVVGCATALSQFNNLHAVGWVLVVYAIGQIIEGYVLTPYLVGSRIGLHPVTVIFAIMAGGALFGFFGVLIALPVAAVSLVLLRHLFNEKLAVN